MLIIMFNLDKYTEYLIKLYGIPFQCLDLKFSRICAIKIGGKSNVVAVLIIN